MSLLVLMNESPPLTPPPHSGGGRLASHPPPVPGGGIKGGGKGNPPLRSRWGTKGGVEVGIYTSGKLVGSGVLQYNVCGIAVWGDDPTTDEIDGALEGQKLELFLVDEGGRHSVNYESLSGNSLYHTDGLWVVKLIEGSEIPSEFQIVSTYPNPFNASTTITYSLPKAANVELKLFDLTGREITTLVSGNKQPGVHTATLTATDMPSGLYFVRLEASEHTLTRKVMLIR